MSEVYITDSQHQLVFERFAYFIKYTKVRSLVRGAGDAAEARVVVSLTLSVLVLLSREGFASDVRDARI